MVKVQLKGVFAEHTWKDKLALLLPQSHNRWYSLIALDLFDETENRQVAEWFYLVVCSPQYKDKPTKKGPALDPRYTVVVDKIDTTELLKIAREKFGRVHADNWDEFYQKMNQEFLHED